MSTYTKLGTKFHSTFPELKLALSATESAISAPIVEVKQDVFTVARNATATQRNVQKKINN